MVKNAEENSQDKLKQHRKITKINEDEIDKTAILQAENRRLEKPTN